MLVIAHHHINDPANFWAAAAEVTKSLPGSLKVHTVLPSTDAKLGTCLWEADSVEEVQAFLDKNSSQYAQNFCYEVDESKSMGLPKIQVAEAQLS